MAKQTIATLKSWFVTAAKPLQQQFWDWLDSFRHKDDKIGMTDLTTEVQNKLNNPTSTETDLSGLVQSSEKGVAGGVATLGTDGKVPESQLPDLGTKGDTGASAYDLWLAAGNTGDLSTFLTSLHGKDGEDGQSAYTIWLSLGNTGTEADFLSSFKGTDGKNAYEIAVANGFSGTMADWLASLIGKSAYDLWIAAGNTGNVASFLNAIKGNDGASAYEVAKGNGFSGSQSDWLDTLKGKDSATTKEIFSVTPTVADGNYVTLAEVPGNILLVLVNSEPYPATDYLLNGKQLIIDRALMPNTNYNVTVIYSLVSSQALFLLPPIEFTGTELQLGRSLGAYQVKTANSATAYTVSDTKTIGGWCIVLINAAAEPTVTGGTRLSGSVFTSGVNMYLLCRWNGVSIEYYFSEL